MRLGRSIRNWALAAILAAQPCCFLSASAAIRYVKPDATGNRSGTSWANAHTSLDLALLDAAPNDELWIAGGTYLPEIEGTGGDLEPGIRARSFAFIKDLTCYGGFAGNETARSQRDWVANPTILSGNISDPNDYSDNAYTVLHIYSSTVMIDGITIRDGNSDAWALGNQNDFDGRGGGANLRNSTVTFANCRFINNYASYGGAINGYDGDSLNLINCAFVANRALYVSGAVSSGASSHLLSHCTFVANSASRAACSRLTSSNTTTITNCLFAQNQKTSGSWSLLELTSPTTNVLNSVIEEDIPGAFNCTLEPAELYDPPTSTSTTLGKLQLRAGSPGVGIGTGLPVPDFTDMDGDGNTQEPIPLDIDGIVRDSPSDAGAFKFVNLPPSSLILDGSTLVEHLPAGEPIGTFTTRDPNFGTFTYSLVSGDGSEGNSSFAIAGNQIVSAAELDFETQTSYNVRVRSTDNTDNLGQSIEETFTITIIDAIDQTLNIETLDEIAYEPHGGENPGAPHIARLRLSRIGDTGFEQGFQLSVSSAFGGTNDFVIEPQTDKFEPGQSEIDLELIPLFDGREESGYRAIEIRITPRPTEFQLDQGLAIVYLLDGPAAAWDRENGGTGHQPPTMADTDGNGLPDLIDYLSNGTTWQPQFDFDLEEPSVTLMAARRASDFQFSLESSTDLRTWTTTSALPKTLSRTASHDEVALTLPMSTPLPPRLYWRISAEPAGKPADLVAGSIGLNMVGIPAGFFTMGVDSNGDRSPATNVQMTHPFWMAATELTQMQFSAVFQNNSSQNPGPNHPVENVTLDEAIEYCTRLDAVERAAGRIPDGYVYRLPTEAEWEYASIAEGSASGVDLGSRAWYIGNSFLVTHDVGLKLPNSWGLYDMAGNVSEWCLDRYLPNYPGGVVFNPLQPRDQEAPDALQCIRGGHVFQPAEFQNSHSRQQGEPSTRSPVLGFRIVLGRSLTP